MAAPAPAGLAGSVWLVTGAAKGIGLQLVSQLLQQDAGCTVIAAARNPDKAEGLQKLLQQHGQRVRLVQVDVADKDSVQAVAQWVVREVGHVDVLINNAGAAERDINSWEQSDPDECLNILKTNVMGPLLLTAALAPQQRSSTSAFKAAVHISSDMGSLGHFTPGVKEDVQAWAKFIEGGQGVGPYLTAEQSAQHVLNVFKGLKLKDSGRFLTWEGKTLPWW